MSANDYHNEQTVIKLLFMEAVALILGTLLMCGMTLVYVISVPVFIFRYVLCKSAKILRPDLGRIVSAQGNVFSSDFFSSKAPRCAIVVPIVVEGHYRNDEFIGKFTTMVNTKDKSTGKESYPEFKQYLDKWFGFPFWRSDPHFNIRNHVIVSSCTDWDETQQNKSASVIREGFAPFIEHLLNKRFEPKRSPWEVYLFNDYEDPQINHAGPKTLLVVRVHHTLADGYAILYALVEGLLESSLELCQLPRPNYVKREKWSQLYHTLTIPLRVLYDVSQYAAKGLRQSPWVIPDEKKSWKQLYGRGKPYPIDKIKEIKNELELSFTSVLLAALSASISQVIRLKSGGEQGNNERAAFFIPLPLPGHPNALRNHVTGAQIDLPLEDYSDPISRVKECEKLLNQQRHSTIPLLLISIARTLGLHTSDICGKLTANRVNIAGLTSFPAGNGEIQIGDTGNKVVSIELAAGALTGVSGVAFMAISYGNVMQFAVTAESAVLERKDVGKLLKLLNEELDLLHDIITVKKRFGIPPSY